MTRQGLLGLVALALMGCDGLDSDYYPYTMNALDSWVHDNATSRDYFAGRVETSYLGRSDAAGRCRDLAISTARINQLQDWSYVCCTVTSDSQCVTKVR